MSGPVHRRTTKEKAMWHTTQASSVRSACMPYFHAEREESMAEIPRQGSSAINPFDPHAPLERGLLKDQDPVPRPHGTSLVCLWLPIFFFFLSFFLCNRPDHHHPSPLPSNPTRMKNLVCLSLNSQDHANSKLAKPNQIAHPTFQSIGTDTNPNGAPDRPEIAPTPNSKLETHHVDATLFSRPSPFFPFFHLMNL